MNPSSELFGWAIFAATMLGPITAVIVTRFIDNRRQAHDRRMFVFRALMANRITSTNPDRIAALNLLQLEFANEPRVLTAWKNYLTNLRTAPPTNPDHSPRFFREREHLFTIILSEMAKVLGIKVEQLELLEGGYYPDGAAQVEMQNDAIRHSVWQLVSGQRPFPIVVTNLPLPESDNP